MSICVVICEKKKKKIKIINLLLLLIYFVYCLYTMALGRENGAPKGRAKESQPLNNEVLISDSEFEDADVPL